MNVSLIEKIKKLLAITEARGASPHEAAAAAAKVQDLLFAHKLSMSDVQQHDAPDEMDAFTVDNDAAPAARDGHNLLMGVLAHFYFCKYVADLDEHRHIIIGKPHDIVICAFMHDRLCRALQRAVHGKRSDKCVRSFWRGACEVIYKRLDAQRTVLKAQATSQALMVQNTVALKAAENRLLGEGRTTSYRVEEANSAAGFVAGVKAGMDVSLSSAITTHPKEQLS